MNTNTKLIEATQYVRPNGMKRPIRMFAPDDVFDAYDALTKRGLHLGAELLPTGVVSFTLEDRAKEEDLGIELIPNDPNGNAKPYHDAIRKWHRIHVLKQKEPNSDNSEGTQNAAHQ